jgi:hypothetical protein
MLWPLIDAAVADMYMFGDRCREEPITLEATSLLL